MSELETTLFLFNVKLFHNDEQVKVQMLLYSKMVFFKSFFHKTF